MHSSHLRSDDFRLLVDGVAHTHTDYFSTVHTRQRLGLVAPQRVDGVGATTLVMAYVTAFYDRYRAQSAEFFAYPAYFSFQSSAPVAHYSMFDIWPIHKNVVMGTSPVERLNAINDRGVNVLILPDCEPTERTYERPQLESARRNIDHCYVYAFEGDVADADVVIECDRDPLTAWADAVFETDAIADDVQVRRLRLRWEMQQTAPTLRQSFRRVSLDEALMRL